MPERSALRGVNLGGWLVTERWMTPGLYEGVDGAGERALGRQLGLAEARRRLTAHRDSFIGEDDFAWIAGRGFDFVRLPVGYWLFPRPEPARRPERARRPGPARRPERVDSPDEGFLPGAEYVDQAFRWAGRYGLQVLLDLHGLPGSQNGEDHSGEVGVVRWLQPGNTERALATVAALARRYGRDDALLGLELINEPRLRLLSRALLGYYDAAYAAVAEHLPADRVVVVSDGFQSRRIAAALQRRRRRGHYGGPRVVLDVHLYRLFTPAAQRASAEQHLRVVHRHWARLLRRLSRRVPVLVGEWSAALPARAFRGLDADARRRTAEEFYSAQRAVFDAGAWAHSYWSYKTGSRTGNWNLRDSGLAGLRPRD